MKEYMNELKEIFLRLAAKTIGGISENARALVVR